MKSYFFIVFILIWQISLEERVLFASPPRNKGQKAEFLSPSSFLRRNPGSTSAAKNERQPDPSRRRFLKRGIIVGGGTLAALLVGIPLSKIIPYLHQLKISDKEMEEIKQTLLRDIFTKASSGNRVLTEEELRVILSTQDRELKTLLPPYRLAPALLDGNRLTHDGLKIIGAFLFLVKNGKATHSWDKALQDTLHPHDVMKLLPWIGHFENKPSGQAVNEEKLDTLERKPPGFLYRFFSDGWEANMYVQRLQSFSDFERYMKDEIHIPFETFKQTFEEYFDLYWVETLRQLKMRPEDEHPLFSEKDKAAIHDFLLIMAIYQSAHKFAEDEIDHWTNLPGRSSLGMLPDASLGFFQGYERSVSKVLHENRSILKKLFQSTDPKLAAIAQKLDPMKSEQEMYAYLKNSEFRYGTRSSLNSFWQLSLIGLMPPKIEFFTEAAKILKEAGIDDGNAMITMALVLDKNRVESVKKYVRQTGSRELRNLSSGQFWQMPVGYMQFLQPVIHMLNEKGLLMAKREFMYFLEPGKKSALLPAIPSKLFPQSA